MRIARVLGMVAALVGLGAAPARADDRAEPKETQLLLPGPVVFATGSDQLLAASDKVLEYVAGYLAAHPKVTVLRIEVHSDSRGAAAYNLKMSKARAAAVARWLVAARVACGRLLPVGFGESKPLVTPEQTSADRAKNRRVDFFVAREKGKKSELPADGGGEIAADPCAKP